jgi:hypothetical protein
LFFPCPNEYQNPGFLLLARPHANCDGNHAKRDGLDANCDQQEVAAKQNAARRPLFSVF